MAVWLSLRPVTQIVGLDHAYWACHSHDRPKMNEQVLNPSRAAVAAVDQLPMHAEGVAKARSERPDLILMDMSLPVLDGWEATRRLKADPETASIPIIALTAHAMAEDERRAREAGCDDFDVKPVELVRLLEKIAALTAGPRQS